MPFSYLRVVARALRKTMAWWGLGVGVFAAVALLLVATKKDDPVGPRSADSQARGGRSPQGAETETERETESESATLDAGGSTHLDPEPNVNEIREDLDEDREAVGDIPEGGLPEVPTVVVPPGDIDDVEGSRDWLVHRVVGEETIDQIAYRYGVKPESLRLWNAIARGSRRAKRGSRLRVKAQKVPPQRVELQYVVKPGDSWAGIGNRYGVDSQELMQGNRGAGRQLKVGQILRMWVDPVVFEWVATQDDDPAGVRPGAVGVGPPQRGRLVNGVGLPRQDGYRLSDPATSYGTTFAVEAILRGVARFQARSGGSPALVFGSMSRRHGGPLEGHVSHQTGRDLDIRLPLLDKYPVWFPAEPERVDWEATWILITAMFDTGDARVAFLDYDLQKHLHKAAAKLGVTDAGRKKHLQWPRGAEAEGLIRHSPGHTTHVQIRFACGPREVECVESLSL